MPIEKLKKVCNVAVKGATEGERANALRIVERECKELGIDPAKALLGDFGRHDGMKIKFEFTGYGNTRPYSNATGFYYSGFNTGNMASQRQAQVDLMKRQYAQAQKDLKRAQAKIDDLKKKLGL